MADTVADQMLKVLSAGSLGNLHLVNGLFDCHRSCLPVVAIGKLAELLNGASRITPPWSGPSGTNLAALFGAGDVSSSDGQACPLDMVRP